MIRKALSVLLTCVMAASVLTGCGGDGAPVAAPSETAESTVNETETPAEEQEAVVSEKTEDVVLRETEYGPVTGTRKGDALVWYGIPYGKAPIGDLRWAAP